MKNKRDEMVCDTAVIGAGASGMAAALACSKGKQRVFLFDRQEKMGRKILVTGNGKCNLTNQNQQKECYRSENFGGAESVLEQFGLPETMELFRNLGLYLRESNGYYYPYSEQAASVRDIFEEKILSNPSIVFYPKTQICQVRARKKGFLLQDEDRQSFVCKSLIVATGGFAGGPKLGCTGDGYAFAREMGHRLIRPLPALTALKSSAPFLKKLSGVRNRAEILLKIDGKIAGKEKGELQWTDYGISGVAIFQLSRFAVVALEKNQTVLLEMDFMPELSRKEKYELFVSLQKSNRKKPMMLFTKGFFPAKLCPVILREAGIAPEEEAGSLTETQWKNLVIAVSQFPLRMNGYLGYEKAQVTRGGVPFEELSDSLESKIHPGLFFTGEVVDVDGTCGGYNLQWAFSSGSVAGKAAWERNQGEC